jgi:hypothetical protein
MPRDIAAVALIAPVFEGDPVHEPVHDFPCLPASAGYGTLPSATSLDAPEPGAIHQIVTKRDTSARSGTASAPSDASGTSTAYVCRAGSGPLLSPSPPGHELPVNDPGRDQEGIVAVPIEVAAMRRAIARQRKRTAPREPRFLVSFYAAGRRQESPTAMVCPLPVGAHLCGNARHIAISCGLTRVAPC